MAAEKPKLRKREIGFALAVGLLGTAGAVAMFEGFEDGGREYQREAREAIAEGPSEMTYEVADFTEVSSIGPQDINIRIGDTFSVQSEGDPMSISQLEVVVEDGRAIIRPDERVFRDNWQSLQSASFTITMPAIDRFALDGSGDVRIDRVEGESFAGTIGGSGSIMITEMNVDEVNLEIFGSGDLVVAGEARETDVTIGGSGGVQAAALRSENASVSILGSGDVSLTVNEEADVSIAGSGDVMITGPAQCSVTTMGSGDVRCAGAELAKD